MSDNINITVYNSKAAQEAAERAEIAASKAENIKILNLKNEIPAPDGLILPTLDPIGNPVVDGMFMEVNKGNYTNVDSTTLDVLKDKGRLYFNQTKWEVALEWDLPFAPTDNQTVIGKNKANPVRIVNDRLVTVTVNGGVQVSAGWAVWVFPWPQNTPFVIRGWDSVRSEIGFFKGDLPPIGNAGNNSNVISSGPASLQGLSKSGGILKGVSPNLNTYIVCTVENATEDPSVHAFLQIEEGTEPTEYEPYLEESVVTGIDEKDIAPSNLVINGQLVSTEDIQLKSKSSSDVEFTFDNSLTSIFSTMEFPYKGRLIKHQFKSKRSASLDVANTFDWAYFFINGVNKHTQSDENAPYRINGWTVGGNHGYRRYNITQMNHGKSTVDIGSVWSDGVDQWVIVGIPDINTIAVSHRTNNSTSLNASILNHVSGATNTSSINSSTKASLDFFPPNKNYSLKVLIDGVEINTNAVHKGKEKLTFIESYEIIEKESLMNWYVSNAGAISVPTLPDGASLARISNLYSFDLQMGCYTAQRFEALNEVEAPKQFQDIMFLMANRISVPYKVYVPKSLPFVQSGDSYDFRVPMSYATPTSFRINFNVSDRVEKTGILADRAMHIGSSENLGFAIGFLPVDDATKIRRREIVTNKAMQFQESSKIYLSGVDSSTITTMKKGDVYEIQGYKSYFFKEGNRTANYIVEAPQGKYYYYDWHTPGPDTIDLPDSFEVVEKSPNVNLISNNKVFIDLNASNPYAYLIVKN